jgi:hypothetical protein
MSKVFLSHSSSDKGFVRKLAASLVTYGIDSWIDEAEIHYGESLITRISESIEEIDLVLAIISENSIDSSWVRKELEWALTREIKSRNIVVVPVLIDRVDIPFFLIDKLYADFTDSQQYSANTKRLAQSIQYHTTGVAGPSSPPPEVAGFGVTKTYRPLKFSLLTSGIIIATALLVILLLLAYAKTDNSTKHLQDITFSGVVVAGEFIAVAMVEIMRDLLVSSLIRRDPNFSKDISGFVISGLPIKRYRRVVARYWHHTLMKVAVFCEVTVYILMLPLVLGVLRIGYLFFLKP